MTTAKQKFAVKLLFWLLPWPISKALPRSLRIYYFGPTGAPPGGWYDYWGTEGFYWPDPAIPLDPDLFPDIPDDIFNPGDLVNPPDPENFPDFPDGPVNPSDPYTPGPGPVNPRPGVQPIRYFDNTYWVAGEGLAWNNVLKVWAGDLIDSSLTAIGTWATDFRASYLYIKWSGTDVYWIHLNDTDDNIIATLNNPDNEVYIPITFEGYDIKWITLDGEDGQISEIYFV